MKNKILLLVVVLVTLALVSCNKSMVGVGNVEKSVPVGSGLYIETIDGCEYIVNYWRGGITHKANCENPIHRSK